MNTEKTNYAAIDIGSNAVRLLIKSLNDKKKLDKELLIRIPIRLGEDVFTIGKISKVKKSNLISLMKAYKELISIYNVVDFRVCATSAMRDASNNNSVVNKVLKKSGIKIDIISGMEEGRLIALNHINQEKSLDGNYLYVDVGGGSTELNIVENGVLKKSLSYNIGTVRLLKESVTKKTWEKFYEALEDIKDKYPDIKVIGTGGNINKIIKLVSTNKNNPDTMTVESLEEIYEALTPLTKEERIKIYSLKPDRAEVITPAAKVFLEVSRKIRNTHIIVPSVGLADGIIDDVYIRRCGEYN